MDNFNQKQPLSIWSPVLIVMSAFTLLDILTTIFGMFSGVASNPLIKILASIFLSAFIFCVIYCTRIIFDLEGQSIKKTALIAALAVCILIDGWTSYEGIHSFIKPQNEDYFGWMLLMLLVIGCAGSPILLSYRTEIKSKLE
ncbi:hypothetical protein [Anabaenopsis arnoldii]|uniref:DUF5658 domain-containing protein n=1 Tax=Anabaenopsis arnoldii TaxID=2152938 RepID=A0ABT5AQR4_9CYAN|nr:hypothetical protein [Anabaenopsis arnoldii]MDB9539068.1 hypothetical protein [Anabaenopsis arnoldii]MDH6091357.1 hypothetical protein [Anabaenopsis arnoldii]